MKRNVFRKSMSAAWILLVLLVCGAPPSQAYQQELKKMATELAARIQALNHSRVTVYEFVDLDMKPNKLGKFLAQQLQLALAQPETELTVVDQSQMPQLFDQMEKLSEGLIDPATGRQLGKVAGTEVLVVGTVMSSSLTIRLDIKAIDLQTAKLITGKGASLARVGVLGKLANESEGITAAAAQDEEETEQASARPAKAKSRPPARSRNDQGVLFELDGCSVSGGALTCAVTATSDRDRWLAVTLESRAWNESGEEFTAAEAKIANTRSQRWCAAKQLLKGVPTALSVTFPQFGDEEWTVERLRLSWYESEHCSYHEWRPVDFEKIALSEDADFTSRPASNRPSHGSSGNSVGATTKRKGGLLQRLSGQVLDALEGTATKMIDKKTRELTGEDEEDGEEPPRER